MWLSQSQPFAQTIGRTPAGNPWQGCWRLSGRKRDWLPLRHWRGRSALPCQRIQSSAETRADAQGVLEMQLFEQGPFMHDHSMTGMEPLTLAGGHIVAANHYGGRRR